MQTITSRAAITKRNVEAMVYQQPDTDDPFYCESNMRALDESYEQLMTGHVVVKTFAELDEMESEAFAREGLARG